MTPHEIVREFKSSGVREFTGGAERPDQGSGIEGTPEHRNTRTPERSRIVELAARAALAKALALAFTPPEGPAVGFLQGALARKVMDAAAHLGDGPALRTAAEALARVAPDGEGLVAEHQRLFRTELAATPYETEYGPASAARKGPVLADVLGFYAAFGFRTASAASELPDHIGAELEFLGLLLLKGADALGRGAAEEAAVAEDAARKFFADHLARWGPAFSQALRNAARHSFYAAVADLLMVFLEREALRFGSPLAEPLLPPGELAEECVSCPLVYRAPNTFTSRPPPKYPLSTESTPSPVPSPSREREDDALVPHAPTEAS
jgi:TorA maturation chaperone TorD